MKNKGLEKWLFERQSQFLRYDLIKLLISSYFEDVNFRNEADGVIAIKVLELIGAVIGDDFSKVRKTFSALQNEKFFGKMRFDQLERFTGYVKKGSF